MLATVLPATFMQLVDVSIVNVAVPSIQRDLGASYAEIQLILACYQLAFACMLITGARLGDILGRRRMFLAGLVGFTITSALCGAAPSPEVLVAGRILQGLAAGVMFPQVISVIQVTFAPAERGRALGLYGVVVGLASIAGPLLGGLVIALDPLGLDWRGVFLVNVPVGIAASLAAARHLPESTAPDARALDVPGALLVTAGLFMLVFPLTEGRERGWPPWIGAMMAAAALTLAGFWVVQRRKTAQDASPLVYTTLLADPVFRRGLILASTVTTGLPSFFLVLTIYLQVGLGLSALEAGLTTLPYALGAAVGSLVSDRAMQRFGISSLQAGCVLMSASMIGLQVILRLLGAEAQPSHLLALLFSGGLGLGLLLSPMTNVILSAVQSREVGSASGVLSTGQQVGGALGVALVGLLFFELLPARSGQAEQAVAGAGDLARRLGFGEALAGTLTYHAAVFAVCLLLLAWLRRARARARAQAAGDAA